MLCCHRSFLSSFSPSRQKVCGCEFCFCFLLSCPLRKSLGLWFLLSCSSSLFARAWEFWYEFSSVIFFCLFVPVLLETLQELGILSMTFLLFIYVIVLSASSRCCLQLQTLQDLPEPSCSTRNHHHPLCGKQ
jgi:hypothetical protein